jgi:glucose/arabinose dehydrogenase
MRRTAALALGLVSAACGGKKQAGTIDAPPIDAVVDAAPDAPIDAPPPFGCTPNPGTKLSVRKIGTVGGLGAIIVTSPPGDERLFVVERKGTIHVFDHEVEAPAKFLDLTPVAGGPVKSGGDEFGLLGLAFDPDYATNGYFYVYYTDVATTGDPVWIYDDILARYKVDPTDPNKGDPKSGQILLSIPDYASNHNGGMLEFGPDGYLYIGTGDGGGSNDPHRTAQDKTSLLGKILRIDVRAPSGGKMYSIPADNPFAQGGGAPEVFVYGARNPWRFSFDRANGDLWIGDVGQNVDEELDYLPAGHQAGVNLGWSMYEENRCLGNYPCSPTGTTFPVDVRNHATAGWHAIIGGQVYRGPCYAGLTGGYFYTDYQADVIVRADLQPDGKVKVTDYPGPWPLAPTSLHADSRGELYLTSLDGTFYHLEASP